MGTTYTGGMFGNGDSLWNDYKNGFGTPSSEEFWLGLDKMHKLTKTGRWELLFKAKWSVGSATMSGKWAFAVYSNFKVDGESSEFRLRLGSRQSSHLFGSLDPLAVHDGAIFR